MTIFLSFFFHMARCRVVTSASAVTVVHPIRRYVFPWGQITDVIVGRDGEMRIVLSEHSSFAVSCFGGSVLGRFTRGIQARKARDGIKAAMAQATGHEPANPVSSSLNFPWKITLAIWVAAMALSIAGWLLASNHVLI